jgi:putative salt-induced outer membrane protein YdiY
VASVEHVESNRQFEIELQDGRKMLATLNGADGDGNQIIDTEAGSISVQLAEFFELDEPEKEFDWESHVELSGNLNKGNTDTANTKLRADTMVKFNDHRHIGELTFFREELAGKLTQERDLLRYNYNWFYRDPWFFSANLTFERDPIIKLDSRVIVSAGVGRDIWDTPRRTLNVQAGAGFQQEKFSADDPDDETETNSAVATWTLRYRQDFFNDDFDLFHNHTITANVSGRTNTSFRTSTGIGYEITDLLSATISLDFNYETHPVGDLTKNEDLALLFGISAEF